MRGVWINALARTSSYPWTGLILPSVGPDAARRSPQVPDLVDNDWMVRRALMFVLASGSIAHAQAPAQEPALPPPGPSPDQPAPPQPAPSPAPPPATPAAAPTTPASAAQLQSPAMQPPPPAPPTVMAKRWAIGLDLGPESLQPDGGSKVGFQQLELAGRFRIRPAIEIGLALHLAGSKDIGAGGLYADVRYRFMAEQKLNVYVLGGLGVLAVAHENATEQAKQGRGSLRVGVGGEYRWNWFALIAELRLVVVGENEDLGPTMTETVDYQLSRYKLSGGSLAVGANFYF